MVIDWIDLAIGIFFGNLMTVIIISLFVMRFIDYIDDREYKHGKNGGKLL